MKRRDFLKTNAAAAGLVGSLTIEPMLAAAESGPQTTSQRTGAPPTDNRPAEYLHRVQGDPFLPVPPVPPPPSKLAATLLFVNVQPLTVMVPVAGAPTPLPRMAFSFCCN